MKRYLLSYVLTVAIVSQCGNVGAAPSQEVVLNALKKAGEKHTSLLKNIEEAAQEAKNLVGLWDDLLAKIAAQISESKTLDGKKDGDSSQNKYRTFVGNVYKIYQTAETFDMTLRSLKNKLSKTLLEQFINDFLDAVTAYEKAAEPIKDLLTESAYLNFIGLDYSNELTQTGKDLAEAISFVPELNIEQNYPGFDEKLKKIATAEQAAWQDPKNLSDDAAWMGEASQSGAGEGTGQGIVNAVKNCGTYLENLQETFVLGPAARDKRIRDLSDDLERFKKTIEYILSADEITKWTPLVKDALKKQFGQSEGEDKALYNFTITLRNMA